MESRSQTGGRAPAVSGFVESALYVADLERSRSWYERVFGFETIMEEGDRLKALAVPGRQVLLLFRVGGSTQPSDTPGGRIPPHDGRGRLHFAFGISREQIEPWKRWLSEVGVEIESEVDCPRGGHSIYFRDPDGHAVELITPGCWTVY
jgi:catechol 2,3-dioxygenase-like lactoylglutathione lyase family enzyme